MLLVSKDELSGIFAFTSVFFYLYKTIYISAIQSIVKYFGELDY